MRPNPARWVACVAILLLAGCFSAGAAADDFSGVYNAEGKTASGSSYKGAVQIENLGSLYAVLWKLKDNEAYKGIAIPMDNVLGAAYGPPNTNFGLVVYRIKGGTLEGIWADSGNLKSELGRESLEGPVGLSGEYKITLGQNRDGVTNYGGKVLIKPNGQTYLLVWLVPKPSTIGVGIRMDDLLVVAYGPDPKHMPGVVAYRKNGPGLEGEWSIGTQPKVGTETLLRP
ncbi:MAG TPA: hypothetical protein VGM59_00200 [Dongiaceae bacterium]